MTVGHAHGMALQGLDGLPVTVECDLGRGLPGVSIVGMGDTAVVQARDRIRAAMSNSGLAWPKSKVVMSLSPADVRKVGSGYDLAMVASILMAQGLPEHSAQLIDQSIIVGELGLDGSVRAVPGVVPIVISAHRQGFRRVVLPTGNTSDAAQLLNVLPNIDVVTVNSLSAFMTWARTNHPSFGVSPTTVQQVSQQPELQDSIADMQDIVGQQPARRAVEVAAAGGHALLLSGPPGSGKSMLAERLPTILPPMGPAEQIETAAIHSIAGRSGNLQKIWAGQRPYVAPHPSVTAPALVGGGNSTISPGAISLAHHGVLFLDEVSELKAGVLDALRIPMETRRVDLSRARRHVQFPAQFQLILATNPCACGAETPADCVCSSTSRHRHRSKISGPIKDRIDLFVETKRQATVIQNTTATADIEDAPEDSATIRQRVTQARQRATTRWCQAGFGPTVVNATVPSRALRGDWSADNEGMIALQELVRSGRLSQRGVDRALRVAWTLADLDATDKPTIGHVIDAVDMYSDTTETHG